MSLFIETIRVESDNSAPLLSYHLARMSRSLSSLDEFSKSKILGELEIKLADLLQGVATNCIRKFRVRYSTEGIEEATLTPYLIRPITTLTLAPITFDYNLKYADRIEINSCYHDNPDSDDVLMLKDGYLTDTSYGNIALLDDSTWYTPEIPLLGGCRRQYLIDTDQVQPKKIRIEAISYYSYLMVFNAMIPFGRILIPTRHLHF